MAVHDKKMAEEYYTKANNKVVPKGWKHHTQGLPPIPTNDAELLCLNTYDVMVLKAFFTEWNSLVQQELDLNNSIEACQWISSAILTAHKNNPPVSMGQGQSKEALLLDCLHPSNVGCVCQWRVPSSSPKPN